MKRFLTLAGALLLAACAAVPALAGPNSIVLTQRNAADTGNIFRTLDNPAATGVMIYNTAIDRPGYLTIGPGLTVSGSVLHASVPEGPAGATGSPGSNGIDGVNGLNGIDGKSAYELATVDGFTGTLQAWLASLKGAAGADGAPGASIVGPAGPQGLPGLGVKGDKGDTGATGATGAQGPAGTPAPTFNFGLPAARTLAVTTPYQASNPAKPAIVTVSPSCSASLSLAGGSTCALQARIGAAPLTCTGGTVVATWTNGNTGALTVGLALNQIVGAPYGINLPTGASFILCPTSGTFTVTAAEQSAG